VSKRIYVVCGLAVFLNAPLSAAEPIRTMTFDAIPLDEPILFRVRDVQLRIPAGYLAPWPRPAMRGEVNERKKIDFNFWMPQRRYVEIDEASLAGFRPREKGRTPPGPGEYVVKVQDLQLLKPDEIDVYRSPDKRFETYTSRVGHASFSFKEEDHGLVRFWRHDWPYPQPEPFLRYRSKDGADIKIILRCTAPHLSTPGKTCDGPVYLEKEELSFRIFFAGEDLSKWRENVLAVRHLFRSWEVTP
jgi:hypothetical protein